MHRPAPNRRRSAGCPWLATRQARHRHRDALCADPGRIEDDDRKIRTGLLDRVKDRLRDRQVRRVRSSRWRLHRSGRDSCDHRRSRCVRKNRRWPVSRHGSGLGKAGGRGLDGFPVGVGQRSTVPAHAARGRDDLKATRAQCLGHGRCVGCRLSERQLSLIFAVTDNERDIAIGSGIAGASLGERQ